MNNLYDKCNFSNQQLQAMVQIYKKYFEPKMPKQYLGTGSAFFWNDENTYPTKKDKQFDPSHGVKGFFVPEANDDPLWDEFKDLLPYMKQSAVITKIPPNSVMNVHTDRAWRPNAIYFPIEGCSKDCISSYYKDGKPVGVYAVNDNAYLTNVHEPHGLLNLSDQTRVALGWNFKDFNMSYEECFNILKGLNYVG